MYHVRDMRYISALFITWYHFFITAYTWIWLMIATLLFFLNPASSELAFLHSTDIKRGLAGPDIKAMMYLMSGVIFY